MRYWRSMTTLALLSVIVLGVVLNEWVGVPFVLSVIGLALLVLSIVVVSTALAALVLFSEYLCRTFYHDE